MMLTTGLVIDFFREYGLDILNIPQNREQDFENVRLYYPGIQTKPGSLYLMTAKEYIKLGCDAPAGAYEKTSDRSTLAGAYEKMSGCDAPAGAYEKISGRDAPAGAYEKMSGRDAPAGAFCAVTDGDGPAAWDERCFAVSTSRPAAEVFALLQERFEALARWDQTLSELLLRDASLQELLECSAPVLKSPCFLQDVNFNLLAACGQVRKEENAFFYETLRSGRAPSGLFTQLLSMSQPEPPYTSPKAISSKVKNLSDQRVLIADCCVHGVTALHFCLYYGEERRAGLPDLIVHLMQRMETGPSVRCLSGKSTDLHDELFAKLLEDNQAPDFDEICSTLGLFRFQHFMAICMDFKGPCIDPASRLTRLRALYPRFWFFHYHKRLYAVLGSNPQTRETDMQAKNSLLKQLQQLGASYGSSLDQFSVKALSAACRQAFIAQKMDGEHGASYADVLVRHMACDFFERHDFDDYCPENFLRLLEDDRTEGTDNLTLLGTYLSNNCNATQVGRILHMHRNNVLYRIGRIRGKYGIDLTEGKSRLMLWILTEKALADREQGIKSD